MPLWATCCLLCLLRGAVWVAHLLERSAISGADVSWEPFNRVPSGLMASTRALECGGQAKLGSHQGQRMTIVCIGEFSFGQLGYSALLWIVEMPVWTGQSARNKLTLVGSIDKTAGVKLQRWADGLRVEIRD